MSTLNDLLRQVEKTDKQLAADLKREVRALEARRAFGLNFERHTPESVELPGRQVRRGDKVRFVPERGAKPSSVDRGLWWVKAIRREASGRIAELQRPAQDEASDAIETAVRAADDLVVMAEFRDPIYPGLVSTGKVERGGDKPYHTVINAENFHSLQALLYTHEGKVDAIYIDPPYNTRDKDWKYNNDYVDKDDIYKHSKWLAMMERRLRLAKRLLNPDNSVLIVTIDEKEYLRLGLLLQQCFVGNKVQMITSRINPKGVARGQEFYRVEEYVFFVFIGCAAITKTNDAMIQAGMDGALNADRADEKEANTPTKKKKVRWGNLLRSGTDARRADRKNQFYPIFLEAETGRLHSIGNPLLPITESRFEVDVPSSTLAIWPIRKDGSEGRWQVGRASLKKLFNEGYVSIGRFNGTDRVSFSYVTEKMFQQIDNGQVSILGRDSNNVVILEYPDDMVLDKNPKTMWNKKSHSGSEYGSSLLRATLPKRDFPFPKSIYAVEDALRFTVSDKRDAMIVDFFSGSGTTAHAVMRLNRQDGGHRQCISVTNNEVSADEQKKLREKGLRPGDPDWEQWGICDYITKPRIKAVITGQTPEGEPIEGDYKFTDEFPMADGFEENVEFFTLTYEAPRRVAHHKSFSAIAPLLWLKAGAFGMRIDKASEHFAVADAYGVLFDLDYSADFITALGEQATARMAFIVSDEDRGFQGVCAELPDEIEPVRLYSSYLTSFTINTGKE